MRPRSPPRPADATRVVPGRPANVTYAVPEGQADGTRVVPGRAPDATRVVPGRAADATRNVPGRAADATCNLPGRAPNAYAIPVPVPVPVGNATYALPPWAPRPVRPVLVGNPYVRRVIPIYDCTCEEEQDRTPDDYWPSSNEYSPVSPPDMFDTVNSSAFNPAGVPQSSCRC